MNYDRQLQGSFWLMLAVQTIGALDMPGHGPRKLPAPRAYVAAIILWSIFGLISDAGGEKAAAAMGWVTVLTGAVVGSFGQTITDFLKTIGDQFNIAPQASKSSGAPGDNVGGSPGTIIA